MSNHRTSIIVCLLFASLAWRAARVQADTVLDANNTPDSATVLASQQFTVSGLLDGESGRANLLLGEYDPTFGTLLKTASTTGDSLTMTGVPLQKNGSAYFRVTGTGDTFFDGDQDQIGRYSVQFDIYDKNHNLLQTLPTIYESVFPNSFDNVWVNPLKNSNARSGGTVDITVNSLVGPGTGNSMDFYVFSGMHPGQAFTASVTNAAFAAAIGIFKGDALLSFNNAGVPTITGHADANGEVLIGVTGGSDTSFSGEHLDTGAYTLSLVPVSVPEPSTMALLACGGALALGCRKLRRQRTP